MKTKTPLFPQMRIYTLILLGPMLLTGFFYSSFLRSNELGSQILTGALVLNFWLTTLEIRNFLQSEFEIGYEAGSIYGSSLMAAHTALLIQEKLIQQIQDPETIKLVLETCKVENLFGITSLPKSNKISKKESESSNVTT